jgi:hypothetical protein
MRRTEQTKRLKEALFGDSDLAERARDEVRIVIGGLDLSSEERRTARGEGGYALQVLCEETCAESCGQLATEVTDKSLSVRAVLLEVGLAAVDFEAIADQLIEEIEEGVCPSAVPPLAGAEDLLEAAARSRKEA